MVGEHVTVLPSNNGVTLGSSLGTLAETLRADSLANAQKTSLMQASQLARQKQQDEIDQKRAADAQNLINAQPTMAGKMAVRQYIIQHNPTLERLLISGAGMPMDEATQQNDAHTTNVAHIGRDASAQVRAGYEDPNAAPASSTARIDANLPGTTDASAKDQFEAQDRDNVTGGANALGTPTVPGVPVPSRSPLANTLRGVPTPAADPAAPAPAAPAAPPATPPAAASPSPSVRPPTPVQTDGHVTAGALVPPPSREASRGPGAVPDITPKATAAPTAAATPTAASAPDYMQGVLPSKPLNDAQMEGIRQRQGLDLDAKEQFGAADKVGTLNATTARNADLAAHERRSDASEADLRAAQAREADSVAANPGGGGRTIAGMVGPQDAESIADAIVSGKQPPVFNARMEGPVRAALARKYPGYDLTKASTDYKATQTYMKTLNGSGQLRLRQAVNFVYETTPLVKELAEQWQGGGFPLLNKAQLLTAKQGALGPQAAKIATEFDSQINEMQTELAIVYRGGNSPTDQAMKKAGEILQSNWSLPTLLANLDLLQRNMAIRRNSIVSARAAAGANNIYDPNIQLAEPPNAGSNPQQPTTTYKEVAVGPNGHKIGSNDGQKTWYDVQTGQLIPRTQ